MPRKLIRSEVLASHGYRLKKYPHRIKLNQNESPYDLEKDLKAEILGRLEAVDWNRYPSPYCDPLRKKIAEREEWPADGVVVSGGSNVLIQAILIAAAVGSKIMSVAPGFSLYEIEGKLLGNRVINVPLNPQDFSLPTERFLKILKKEKPKAVFLANPNAPTGNLFPEEQLLAILKASRGLVVIDEAYYPFSGATLRSHLKKYRNLVILRTLSKAFSLGGVRLGYLLADPKIAGEILKATLPFSVGVLSQAVGEVVLENTAYVSRFVNEVIREREFLYQGLRRLSGLCVYPSHANYILFQSKQSKKIFGGLVEQGILIRDVSGPNLKNALRVSVGSPDENRRFLDVLRKC